MKSSDNLDGEWKVLVDGFAHRSNVLGHYNGKIYFRTDIDAPRYRLVGVDPTLEISDQENWIDILPQSDDLLEGASTAGGQLFGTYLHNACNKVVQYDIDGTNLVQLNYQML